MKKVLIIFFFIPLLGFSQEILSGMQINPAVRQKFLESRLQKRMNEVTDTLPVTLPFFDDFSYDSIYPGRHLWSDDFTFINTDIPIYPPNRGAVTLDAIDADGLMYPNAVPGPQTFVADHLTSRYIRLDSVFSPVPRKLHASDSVYLSFYYQPQGRSANPPLSQDSLILRFLIEPSHDSIIGNDTIHIPNRWLKVWSSKGMSLDTFRFYNSDRYFVQVLLPVTDTQKFFRKNFRFQFYNYVNLAAPPEDSWQSNCDQWNIDNVYLNINRNDHDTIYPEIRFLDRAPGMLKNYESMPYPQYAAAPDQEMTDSVTVIFSNRDNSIRNCRYTYKATNPSIGFSKTFTSPNINVLPYYTGGPVIEHPTVPFFFPIIPADSSEFNLTYTVHDNAAGSSFGDTITGLQKLYNFYAYDDGTPEASYGLTPAGSMLAYRFDLNKPDTLRAIQMYFNHVLNGNNEQLYYLCVWNDNVGTPGDTVWSKLTIPMYSDHLNKYFTYHTPAIPVSGTIYIGWIQTAPGSLGLGFDRYNDHSDKILYNTSGKWFTSSYYGSLMIRPVLGKPIPLGISDPVSINPELTIYPNPCSGSRIHLRTEGWTETESSRYYIRISDLPGKVIISRRFSENLDVSELCDGMYILILSDGSGNPIATRKLIISR